MVSIYTYVYERVDFIINKTSASFCFEQSLYFLVLMDFRRANQINGLVRRAARLRQSNSPFPRFPVKSSPSWVPAFLASVCILCSSNGYRRQRLTDYPTIALHRGYTQATLYAPVTFLTTLTFASVGQCLR